MFTRKQYLNKECTHRQYYAQFVNSSTLNCVKNSIGVSRLKDCKDEHLNDIPLKAWDAIPVSCVSDKMKEAGDFLTTAGKVCICKEAAKQLKEA